MSDCDWIFLSWLARGLGEGEREKERERQKERKSLTERGEPRPVGLGLVSVAG